MPREDVGKRVREKRVAKGWSMPKLAREITRHLDGDSSVHKDTVRGWENGRIQLWKNDQLVTLVATVLEADKDELLNGSGELSESPAPIMRMVPLLGGIQAGDPFDSGTEVSLVPVEDWNTPAKRWGHPVIGPSMEDALYEGDRAFFEGREPVMGNVVRAVNPEGAITIKEYKLREGGGKLLVAANPEWVPRIQEITEDGWKADAVLMEVHRTITGGVRITIRNADPNVPLRVDTLRKFANIK